MAISLGPWGSLPPYIPQSLSELGDFLASMLVDAPKFVDKNGFFPDQDIESEFDRLAQAYTKLHLRLGEDCYRQLSDYADRAKALFLADPDDDSGDAHAGRRLLVESIAIVDQVRANRRGQTGGVPPEA